MFITFEGLDGAGKSTQIARLVDRLNRAGHKVTATREPGGTPVGDELRRILLDSPADAVAPATEALLYAASRAQLVARVISPALAEGRHVLCDRYVDASLAYQGQGLNLGMPAVAQVNQFATGGLQPDLTFLFDVSVDISRHRIEVSRQGQQPDRIEQRDDGFFQRVRNAFLQIAAEQPQRVVILDATAQPGALEEEIWYHVAKRLDILNSI